MCAGPLGYGYMQSDVERRARVVVVDLVGARLAPARLPLLLDRLRVVSLGH